MRRITDPFIDESSQANDVGNKLRSLLLLSLLLVLLLFLLFFLLLTVVIVVPGSRPTNEGPAVTEKSNNDQ